MEGKQTNPSTIMNGILMRVMPLLGDDIRNIVNRDHPISQDKDNEEEDCECEVAQKIHGALLVVAIEPFEVNVL